MPEGNLTAKSKLQLARRSRKLIEHLSSQTTIGAVAAHESAITARKLAESSDSRLLEAYALLQLGRTDGPLVYPETAYEHFSRAGLIFQANDDPVRAAQCAVGSARALYDMGRERSSIQVARQALAEPLLPVRVSLAALGVMALCHAHIGELDVATRLLENNVRPLVESSGTLVGQAHLLRSQAIVQLHMMFCRHHPELWLWYDLAGATPFESPVPEPKAYFALLDRLQAIIPSQAQSGYVHMLRQVVAGLFEDDQDCVPRLAALADREKASDPPLACWTLYFEALLLIHGDERECALAVFNDALALATRWHMTRMVRDIQLQLSRVHETAGDLVKSFKEFSLFAPLMVQSSLRDPPAAGTQDSAPLHRLRDLIPGHVKRAIRFIEENLQASLGVDEVAEYCKTSRRTLEISFVENTSMTIAHFIKRTKLEHAAMLLREADMPIREAAKAVGYRWPAAFSRDFQRHFGASPSDWRRLRHINTPDA